MNGFSTKQVVYKSICKQFQLLPFPSLCLSLKKKHLKQFQQLVGLKSR